ERIRDPARGARQAPPRPPEPLRPGASASHVVRPGHPRAAARAGRGHRDRRGRSANRHLSRAGRRWPAREQDRLRRPHHAPADRRRCPVPERALPDREQADRDADPQVPPGRARRGGAGAGASQGAGGREHGLRRQPDPELRAPAVPAGQGPPHRLRGGKRPGRPRREPGSLHPCLFARPGSREGGLTPQVDWPAIPRPVRAQEPAPPSENPVSDVTLQTEENPAATLPEPQPTEAPVPGPGSMIVFESVTKVYEPDVTALRDVSFVIDKGEFVFVVGASGSGKSTIIRLLLKELEPTRGRIVVGGRDLTRLKRSKVPLLRRNVGCVFQDFKLLPTRTAAENVAYALRVQGESSTAIRRKVPEVLALVGLAHKSGSRPDELSGGEQQRVS